MGKPVTVKIKKLHKDAKLPVFSTEGAAGADLHAYIPRDGHSAQFADSKGPFTRIYADDHAVIGCGIAIEVPEGYEAQVRPRSGLAAKLGISIVNSPGTIDSDFRGEIGAILINHGALPFDVYTGDRIAQIVVVPIPKVCFVEANELTETKRGAGGMGSTGVSS
jgi:dUTP pyrophosphatase